MSKVLMIGPGKRGNGGIVKVIEYYKSTKFWEKERIVWIETFEEGSKLFKLGILLKAIYLFFKNLPGSKIAHIHYAGGNSANRKMLFFLLSKIFGLKIVSHLHIPILDFPNIINWSFKQMVKRSDRVIVLSPIFARDLKTRIIDREYIVLNNPSKSIVDGEIIKEDLILFAARLERKKGYMDLIDSLNKIADLHDYKTIFAGSGEIKEAQDKISSYKLKNVQTIGWIDSPAIFELYKKAKIFVLPSYGEGFPISIIDALSNKCAIITTPVGGIPDFLINGKNSLFFDPGDVNSLSNLLLKLINDDDYRIKLSNNGHALAQSVFNIDIITDKLSCIYLELLSEN